MKINLIIDGNYILNKNVFPLHKSKMLYGLLHEVMHNSIKKFAKLYHFDNVFFVSDCFGSWRKELFPDYKGNRKKSEDIDWEFIMTAYDEIKTELPKNIKVLEKAKIEGDDWIYQLVKRGNEKGYSNLVISGDYDMKQLLYTEITPESSFINIMSNEKFNAEIVFVPENFEVYINHLKTKLNTNDLFTLSDDGEFISFFKKFTESREVKKVDPYRSLMLKMISGDKSDNIPSIFSKPTKTGKMMGIGDKGAEKIYDTYLSEFGLPDINDDEFKENIADLICDMKKVNYTNSDKIIENINLNCNLVNLELIPDDIKEYMDNEITFK